MLLLAVCERVAASYGGNDVIEQLRRNRAKAREASESRRLTEKSVTDSTSSASPLSKRLPTTWDAYTGPNPYMSGKMNEFVLGDRSTFPKPAESSKTSTNCSPEDSGSSNGSSSDQTSSKHGTPKARAQGDRPPLGKSGSTPLPAHHHQRDQLPSDRPWDKVRKPNNAHRAAPAPVQDSCEDICAKPHVKLAKIHALTMSEAKNADKCSICKEIFKAGKH